MQVTTTFGDVPWEGDMPEMPSRMPQVASAPAHGVSEGGHPAAGLLDTVNNQPARARAEEAAEWRQSQQHLIDTAEQAAEALKKVLRDENAFMHPIAKVTNWHDVMSGRRHNLFHHLDVCAKKWRDAQVQITQLEAVKAHVMEVSLQRPGSRMAQMGTVTLMVKNSRGGDESLRQTVAMTRHLCDQIKALFPSKHGDTTDVRAS